nr:MAG TPA: hypothetical protein [Caudoviricetes sp.]
MCIYFLCIPHEKDSQLIVAVIRLLSFHTFFRWNLLDSNSSMILVLPTTEYLLTISVPEF